MGFLFPWMWVGAAAVGIPIALHFMFRSRYRTMPWAAMKFLLESIQQTSRRLQFQEYLLLFARMCLLLFLVLAFTRVVNVSPLGFGWLLLTVVVTAMALSWFLCPFWKLTASGKSNLLIFVVSQVGLLLGSAFMIGLLWSGPLLTTATAARTSGAGDAVDAVFIIDTSYSMSAHDGTLAAAQAASLNAQQATDDPYLAALKKYAAQRDANEERRAGGVSPLMTEPAGNDRTESPAPPSRGIITRLDRARAAALAILSRLPPHSTVRIISASDRASLLGPEIPSHLERAQELIDKLKVQHTATDFLPAMVQAAQELDRGHSPNKEIYLFSDMQASGWTRNADALKQTFAHIRKKEATVYLVRCGTREPRNVAIVGITAPHVPHTGASTDFSVHVRNTGTQPVKDLSVSLMVAGDRRSKETLPLREIQPGETRAVTLPVRLKQPGPAVLTAEVMADELEADNRFHQVIQVRDKVRVLVVDGTPHPEGPKEWASFYLMHALAPVVESQRPHHYVQPHVVSVGQAAAELLDNHDVCVLVNCALPGGKEDEPRAKGESLSPAFLDRLQSFVREEGRGLMIFVGDRVQSEACNQWLHVVLPGKLLGQVACDGVQSGRAADSQNDGLQLKTENTKRKTGPHVSFDQHSLQEAVFLQMKSDDHYQGLGEVRIKKVVRVVAGDPTAEGEEPASRQNEDAKPKTQDPRLKPQTVRVLLRYTNGLPAVLARQAGRGQVLLVTTSADRSWNDWSSVHGKTFVPFVDLSLVHLLQAQMQSHNYVAGQPIRWRTALEPERQRWSQPVGSAIYGHRQPGRQQRFRYFLRTPDLKEDVLPPQIEDGRAVLTTADTTRAGIYQIVRRPARGERATHAISGNASALRQDVHDADRSEEVIPFAVIADLRESENLEALSEDRIDQIVGTNPKPIHVTAGDDPAVFVEASRLRSEWTMYLLVVALLMGLGETTLACFCDRGRKWRTASRRATDE